MNYFNMYRDILHFLQLTLIAIAGIIAYMPLSIYDFILKKNVGIDVYGVSAYAPLVIVLFYLYLR